MTDCTEDYDYGETYSDLEKLLQLADSYNIGRSSLPKLVDIDESNKNTFAEEFNRIANEVQKKNKSNPDEKQHIANSALIISLKRRIKCYLEILSPRAKGGKKSRRQKTKRHQQRRRKSLKQKRN
jgi:hypothetical protein